MPNLRRAALVLAPSIAIALAACGGGNITSSGSRTSGQSNLMSGTLAGKCDPLHHDRPFVIEWDATDMSSFEAHAAKDVVFVKYEGCDLKVIDGCVDDSVPGKYGTYQPAAWTSGSVEQFDVKNQDDLYAKLPLGAATLGGRVAGGEQFHMKYFVSGQTTATRTKVFRGALATNPACADATHFVYAYNLGAFELKSSESTSAEGNAGIGNIGVGGDHSHEQSAEKHGGDLSTCSGNTAKDIHTCRVPIRLVVRPITDGDDPEAAAQAKGSTPDPGATPAGTPTVAQMQEAQNHRAAAQRKFTAKDGQGCLDEFDQADRIDTDPSRRSTNPGGLLQIRAMCEMLAGHCTEGKRDFRISRENQSPDWTPEQLDRNATDIAGQYCRGTELGPRDKMVAADRALRDAESKHDATGCIAQYNTLKQLLPTIGQDDEQEKYQRSSAEHAMYGAADCAADGGQCAVAKQMQLEIYGMLKNDAMSHGGPVFERVWAAQHPACAGH